MIPKIIHYCWFGRNPKPALAEKCIASWHRFCPDYEIIEWNEDNFDIFSCPLYVRQAYEAKKWAFVTDYVRLQLVYEHGGIYMDTDVELVKKIHSLLTHSAFLGFEDGVSVATGLGFGAEKEHPLVKEIMDDYAEVAFVKEDGSFDTETCPMRNTKVLLRHGLMQDNSKQILDGDVLILPSDYLCPLDYYSGELRKTPNTISIHWFDGSWKTEQEKKWRKQELRKVKIKNSIDRIVHFPNWLLMKLIGKERYKAFKNKMKR